MSNKTIGVFLSDIHLPDEINLTPVFKYVKDLYTQCQKNGDKFLTILGGDIIDAKGMHGIESMQASNIKLEWYDRDKELLTDFLKKILSLAPKTELVYLEGNHCQRYKRIMSKYPDAFGGRFDFETDVVKKVFPKAKWVSYGDYNSYFKLGDTIFLHGTIYPTNHAKKYAEIYAPFKIVYGHLHHYQAFTIHNAMPELPAHYALTAGCLTKLSPEWKRGQPHMWQLGFCDFVSINGITTAAPHILDNRGRFMVGGKVYE
jgi:hypothetical protein